MSRLKIDLTQKEGVKRSDEAVWLENAAPAGQREGFFYRAPVETPKVDEELGAMLRGLDEERALEAEIASISGSAFSLIGQREGFLEQAPVEKPKTDEALAAMLKALVEERELDAQIASISGSAFRF